MEREFSINTSYGVVEILAEYKEIDCSFDHAFGIEHRYQTNIVAVRCWLDGFEYTPTDPDLLSEMSELIL